MKGPEEAAIKQITDGLRLSGATVYRIRERIPARGFKWQNLSDGGIPDLYFWLPLQEDPFYGSAPAIWASKLGKWVLAGWVEVKSRKGTLRPLQSIFLREAEQAGVTAFLARSWEEVKTELQRRGVKVRCP